jgi:hypothetical protein
MLFVVLMKSNDATLHDSLWRGARFHAEIAEAQRDKICAEKRGNRAQAETVRSRPSFGAGTIVSA